MLGRATLLAFIGGASVVHLLAGMPSPGWRAGLFGAALSAGLAAWRFQPTSGRGRIGRQLLWLIVAGLLGFASTAQRVQQRLDDRLVPLNEGKVSRIVLRVAGLVQLDSDQRRFVADVISSRPPGVPARLQVSWSAPGWAGPYGRRGPVAHFPDIKPGQVWRMALTLKTPSGLRNPNAFDYEAFQFAKGIRANGSVRGIPQLLDDDPWVSMSVLAERARHYVRQRMLPYVQEKRFGGVLLALAIGDQNSIPDNDWKTFNAVALTHAIVVSGSHITMVAALGGMLTLYVWRRARWRGTMLAELCPAQIASALAALLVAWLYCLLAGWGVPAQRTFLMLAVVACAYVLRVPATASRIFCVAAFIVVLFDPWSVFATGFWLSFAAVYILMAQRGWVGVSTILPVPGVWRKRMCVLWAAAKLQLVITVALLPALAFLFSEISLVSPLANAYAIPLLGLVVTPAALLLALVSIFPATGGLCELLAWSGHAILQLMMAPTHWLAQSSLATFAVAAGPLWLVLLAGLGVVLATQLHGLRLRHACWLLTLPMLLYKPSLPGQGYWQLAALDVGQGSATLIQTGNHAVLVDTGVRSSPVSDAGSRVIVPYLKSLGVRRLSALVVSHADIDHAGGLLSVLQAIPVDQVYASFDVGSFLKRELLRLGLEQPLPAFRFSPCRYGTTWQFDKVGFAFLWPAHTASRLNATGVRNAAACVLRVQGVKHSALLPGDIGREQEQALVQRGLPATDVVLVAHHGSGHSSHTDWIQRLAATHAVAQVGHQNRYGHPLPAVQQRWQQAGVHFWRTDLHGAIRIHSTPDALLLTSERLDTRRYWNAR